MEKIFNSEERFDAKLFPKAVKKFANKKITRTKIINGVDEPYEFTTQEYNNEGYIVKETHYLHGALMHEKIFEIKDGMITKIKTFSANENNEKELVEVAYFTYKTKDYINIDIMNSNNYTYYLMIVNEKSITVKEKIGESYEDIIVQRLDSEGNVIWRFDEVETIEIKVLDK